MKKRLYLQPATEVVAAAPSTLLSGSLTEEGESDQIPVFDDKLDYVPL